MSAFLTMRRAGGQRPGDLDVLREDVQIGVGARFRRDGLQPRVVDELGAQHVLGAGEKDARLVDRPLRPPPCLFTALICTGTLTVFTGVPSTEIRSVTGGSSAPRCPCRPTLMV